MCAASGISPIIFTPTVSPRKRVCIVPLRIWCIAPAAWSRAGSIWTHVRYLPSQVWEVITEPSVEARRPTITEVQLCPSYSWHKVGMTNRADRTSVNIFFMVTTFSLQKEEKGYTCHADDDT